MIFFAKWPVLVAFALAGFSGSAMCDKGVPKTQPVAQAPQQSAQVPLLWKVSDKDNSIYLLGSFHLLKQSDYPLSPDVDAAFADAKSVMFEIDIDSMSSPEALTSVKRYAMLDPGKKLSDLLPPETKQKLEAIFKLTGATMDQVDSSAPWALDTGLVIGLSQSLGFSQDAGMDKQMAARAKAAGKPMLALETLESQIKAIHDTPLEEQVTGITDFVNDPKQLALDLLKLHEDWMKGDAQTLDQTLRGKMEKETPESYRLINVARNDAWVPQLQALLDQHSKGDNTLVVVGAMHLLGQDGVVEKLRAKGYKVERICSACPAVQAH